VFEDDNKEKDGYGLRFYGNGHRVQAGSGTRKHYGEATFRII